MKNTEPGQIAKAKEQTKPESAPIASSSGNAYNDLKSLYNMVKDNIEIYSTESGKGSLSKELDDFKDVLFDYLSKQKVSHNELENTKNRLEYLFCVIKGRDLNELNLHRNELNDAFDFDLGEQKPINGYNEIKAFYQQCENLETSAKKSTNKPKPEFKEFFKGLNDDEIVAVYNKFVGYGGKKLAALIDILHNEKGGLHIISGDDDGYSLDGFVGLFQSGKRVRAATGYLKFDKDGNVECKKDAMRGKYITDDYKQKVKDQLDKII